MFKLLARLGYLFAVFYQAIVLDIWDLNYTYSNPRSFNRYLAIGSGWPIKIGIWPRILSFFFHMVEGFGYLVTIRSPQIRPGATLLFAITQNQSEGLKPLREELKNCYLIKDRHNVREGVVFPAAWAYLLSLFFLPILLVRFWQKRKQVNLYALCQYRLDGYWLAYGYYIVARLWHHRVKPAVVIFSNDHSMECRVWNKAAREEKSRTFYLQHASVSDEFPPLSFDYALLDGIDAFEIYNRVGPSQTQVYLVGNLKHDHFYKLINQNSVAKSAGICTNILDPIDSVATLSEKLRANFPEQEIYLRPHPADKRFEEWRALAVAHSMKFSDPKAQNVYTFLQQVDVIVAGSSSIHVEAALLNVYPIFYDFSQNPLFRHIYSFLERGLCEEVHSIEDLIASFAKLTQEKPNIRYRAKPYCATVNTSFDGRATQLVQALIESAVTAGAVSFGSWQRLPGYSLEGYQLVDPLNSLKRSSQ